MEDIVIDLDKPDSGTVPPPVNVPEVQEDELGAPIQPATQAKDPAEADLKAQHDKLQREVASERQARQEAERRAATVEVQASSRVANADLQSVQAAKAELAQQKGNTKAALAFAMEQGNFTEAADLQERLNAQQLRETQLSAAERNIKHAIDNPRPIPQQPQAPQQKTQADFEAMLSGLTAPTREWMRKNPDYFFNEKLNTKAYAAHLKAVTSDIEADTPEYFSFVERELGMNGQQAKAQARMSDEPGASFVSAPVSRGSSPSSVGAPTTRQITLSAEEVATARDLGMTPREYAENKVALAREGRIGRNY